mmetsp:Transcript_6590/g.14016  ORF Transcript_6590/g.14016 Transcript_6590/m.14016 type:complete len:117 (+) Transcript_6590:127-477(+)
MQMQMQLHMKNSDGWLANNNIDCLLCKQVSGKIERTKARKTRSSCGLVFGRVSLIHSMFLFSSQKDVTNLARENYGSLSAGSVDVSSTLFFSNVEEGPSISPLCSVAAAGVAVAAL